MRPEKINGRKHSLFHCAANILIKLILLFFVVIALFPLGWMLISSVKPTSELFSVPPTVIVENPTIASYKRVLFESAIPRSFFNSLFITIVSTCITLILAILAGYGFARFRFRGNKTLSTALLFGQMMPAVVLLIPLYRIFSAIHFIDTYRVNILTNIAVNVPMAVLTLTGFISSIPRELDEAAMIDGCGRTKVLRHIIIPVIKPGIVTAGIFAFLNTWEEFMFAYNFTNSSKYKTLSIAVREFEGQFQIDWGAMMSAAVIISVPVLLLFLLCNKYFIKGITSGAVKG